MRHTLSVIMLGAICWGASGCGKSDDQPAVATTVATAPAQPEEVLNQFLSAVKSGHKEEAEGLLTTVAREKTAAEGIGIGNISSSTMSFVISGVQPLLMPDGKEAAHVSCVFTDKLEDGKTESHNIIWAMRKETVGWRVAGMAWTPFAGEPPILMNFEDPADMLNKQKLLAEEQERRANPQPAQQPATTVAGTPAAGTPAATTINTGVVPASNMTPIVPSSDPANVSVPTGGNGPQQADRFSNPGSLR